MNQRVVAAEWVADRLDELAVVDVRDAWEYDGIGHIPTAVNVPFDTFRADEHGEAETGMLPGADAFAALAAEVGIDNDSEIVAYDDTHGVFAARFLVTAELYGHDPERLHLLNGDYSSWNLEHEVSSEEPTPEPTSYDAAFDEDGPLVGIEFVREALEDPDTVIVDTREKWEYEEGHIPGAVRVDWRELVDDDTRGLRPEAEIRELLEDRGVTPDKHVLLYCNTARRISHTYTVLRALGYEELAFYEGSLTEWEREGGELEAVES
ncbi:sulfurtransferase [Natronomonas sp.]|uniref:sulfurtransferase n=1 Tax=Natronomonas sp. TaxID=2184060 RepID=UPI002FC27E1E